MWWAVICEEPLGHQESTATGRAVGCNALVCKVPGLVPSTEAGAGSQ